MGAASPLVREFNGSSAGVAGDDSLVLLVVFGGSHSAILAVGISRAKPYHGTSEEQHQHQCNADDGCACAPGVSGAGKGRWQGSGISSMHAQRITKSKKKTHLERSSVPGSGRRGCVDSLRGAPVCLFHQSSMSRLASEARLCPSLLRNSRSMFFSAALFFFARRCPAGACVPRCVSPPKGAAVGRSVMPKRLPGMPPERSQFTSRLGISQYLEEQA